jgi:hypothetical protein
MAEILKFPSDKIQRPPTTASDEDRESFRKNKERFVERIVDHYGMQLLNKLAMHGFDVEDSKFMYDYIFAMETLRACLYRNVGISHPLQRLSDASEEVVGDSEFDVEEDE